MVFLAGIGVSVPLSGLASVNGKDYFSKTYGDCVSVPLSGLASVNYVLQSEQQF